VINLPYTLLLGLAAPLKRELKVPICCTLQGEDLFLDGLGDPYKEQSLDLIRKAARQVDVFLPVSQYYCDYMPGYLGVPAEKMRLVPLGIALDGYAPRPRARSEVFTIGYLARIAPEKGLHLLADAYRRLRRRPGIGRSRLVAAGYLAPEHHTYLDRVRSALREDGLEREFEYRGEVDRSAKVEFLQKVDVFSVPATYHEPKGMFLFEAMASGVPVVQPRHGAFPEIIEKTGGGILVDPDNAEALADGILELWQNHEKAHRLGLQGAAGVREHSCTTCRLRSTAASRRQSWGRPAAARARCSTSWERSSRRLPAR
jgi:glycosyltransferase involved in cell wall biosynthesis